MHYYQKHIGDYIRDTAHLTMIEEGAYNRLLDLYYLEDGNIPKETESVIRRLRARTDEEREAVKTVLHEFFNFTDEYGWHHKRCDKEIELYHKKAEKARKNGKLGGRPPKTDPVISRNPEKTQTKANQEPITINQKRTSEKKFSSDDVRLAEHMHEKIKDIAPKAKEPNFEKWADLIRLMRERDGYELSEIRRVFEWANADDFWQSNILGPDKLRKQFTRLQLLANKQKQTIDWEQLVAQHARKGETFEQTKARLQREQH